MTKKPSRSPRYGGNITINDWMVRLYSLQGDNLIIYAAIHSFSKDGKKVFNGSLRYLAFWTGKTKPTIIKSLKYLLSKNLIGKKELRYTRINQKRHYCEYWSIISRFGKEQQKELINSVK